MSRTEDSWKEDPRILELSNLMNLSCDVVKTNWLSYDELSELPLLGKQCKDTRSPTILSQNLLGMAFVISGSDHATAKDLNWDSWSCLGPLFWIYLGPLFGDQGGFLHMLLHFSFHFGILTFALRAL